MSHIRNRPCRPKPTAVVAIAGLLLSVHACEPKNEEQPQGPDLAPAGCTQGKILNFEGGCQCPKGYEDGTDGGCVEIGASRSDGGSTSVDDAAGGPSDDPPAGSDAGSGGGEDVPLGCPSLLHPTPVACEGKATFGAGEMFYGEGDGETKLTVVPFELGCDPVTNGEFASFLEATGNDASGGYTYYMCDGCYDWDCTTPGVKLHPELLGIDCSAAGYAVKSICQATPGGPKTASCAEHPVTSVTWLGAQAYCEWKGGRLPSQAEWEYVAKPEQGCSFAWGDAAPGAQLANCAEVLCKDGFDGTSPAGTFPAGGGAGGVRDLIGNVAEWTADCFATNLWSHHYEPYGPTSIDPPEESCSGDQRTIRGSGYDFQSAVMLDVYVVNPMEEWRGAPSIGFRCAF